MTYFSCARAGSAASYPYLAQPCSDRLSQGYVSHKTWALIHLGHLAQLRNSQHGQPVSATPVTSHGDNTRYPLEYSSPLHGIQNRACFHFTCPFHSSVGIATGYGLDGRVSIPGRGKIFLFSIASRPALGPTQPPIQWVPVRFSRG
jgi:hypothetical protein